MYRGTARATTVLETMLRNWATCSSRTTIVNESKVGSMGTNGWDACEVSVRAKSLAVYWAHPLLAWVALILLDTLEVVIPREDSMELRILQGANNSSPTNRTDSQRWVFGVALWIPCIFQSKNDLGNCAVTKVTEIWFNGKVWLLGRYCYR